MNMPNIYGFNKCSEIGIDTFAPSIFLGGCNLRCPYCMNSKLISSQPDIKTIDLGIVKQYVEKEKCEWLMISGGEPTCTQIGPLFKLLEEIKSWGCKIGMSTNGTNPEILKSIISYLSYVAMDIKASDNEDLESIGNKETSFDVIRSHIILLQTDKDREDFTFEVRTTLYPPYIKEEQVRNIGQMLNKKEKWVFQQFRHAKKMFDPECANIKPYTLEEVQVLVEIAKEYTEGVELRYV